MVTAPERLAPPTRNNPDHQSRPLPAAGRRTPTDPAEPDALVAQAIAAGMADPVRAAERLLAAAGRDPARLRRARSLLIRRLRLRSDDFEAALALRIVERALAATPHPDGPWRWQDKVSPRRIRAVRRRAARRGADYYRRPAATTQDPMR